MKKVANPTAKLIPFERKSQVECPLYLSHVQAGFPSPADDYLGQALDLNDLLVRHPEATFFVRVEGDSMVNAGIHHGDILVVDRSLTPTNNRIVIAVVFGELTVKRLIKEKDKLFLVAENPEYSPIEITAEMEMQIWGVASHVIHSL